MNKSIIFLTHAAVFSCLVSLVPQGFSAHKSASLSPCLDLLGPFSLYCHLHHLHVRLSKTCLRLYVTHSITSMSDSPKPASVCMSHSPSPPCQTLQNLPQSVCHTLHHLHVRLSKTCLSLYVTLSITSMSDSPKPASVCMSHSPSPPCQTLQNLHLEKAAFSKTSLSLGPCP